MVHRIPSMVNMARTREEKEEAIQPSVPSPDDLPDYPFGLSICLCQDELEKLGLEDADLEPGDMIHIHSLALITSVSKNANVSSGPQTRVELTLAYISAEDEEEEDEESEEDYGLYKK